MDLTLKIAKITIEIKKGNSLLVYLALSLY